MSAAVAPNPILHRLHANRGMIFPLACIGLLMVLLVPLPTSILDLLLVLNITLSVIVLVTTIYVQSPLEFAVFPSLLLAVTLFRLVLNVATTRLILGMTVRTPDAALHSAGEVVLAFSNFVAGDKLAVGVIIFAIIFVIQFVVITKGCARISEVAARFTLDAMPGKQMAIDADLNAGAITEIEARRRREEVSQQADFYGAMDGAGKFVRGDAIAAVIITLINIIAGLYIGMAEKGWTAGHTAEVFTKLTIGDGLVSQVPAFIVSLGAGLIVTRSSSRSDLGDQVISQMFARPKALIIAAAFLALLSLTGLPKIPLLVMGAACAGIAYLVSRRAPEISESTPDVPVVEEVEKLLDLDVMEIEVGVGLIRLAEPEKAGDLLDRIASLRREIAQDLGILIPAVRVHDNPDLDANDYLIKLKGIVVARGVTYPDQFLAVDRGDAAGTMPDAEETTEPWSGRLAYWITESQVEHAESLAYDNLGAAEVLTRHLASTIRTHAHELLSRQEVKKLLDNLKQRSPALVDEVVPAQVKPGQLQQVLANLLREGVGIRDLETILETLSNHAADTKDPDALTEHVRQALARQICRQYANEPDNRLDCLLLDPALDQQVNEAIEEIEFARTLGLPPALVQRIIQELQAKSEDLQHQGRKCVLLCAPHYRYALRRLVETSLPELPVLSFAEVSPDIQIESAGTVAGAAAPAESEVATET